MSKTLIAAIVFSVFYFVELLVFGIGAKKGGGRGLSRPPRRRVASGRFCWRLDIILRTEDTKGKIGNENGSARSQPRFEAEWRWVCGMPGVNEGLVASSPSVCGVWAHRML
jgi:hypothetical protein